MSADSSSANRRGSAASSDAGQGAPGRWSTSQMESSVTRLLVATKQLLEALTRWSLRNRCTESDVSDIYVRLGNDFNSAKLAFQSYGISMDDLASVPSDLRTCLEECLSEEASPQVLEVHLPRIREIIIGLLQGLKMKQAEYKQLLLVQRANSTTSAHISAASSSSDSGSVAPAAPTPAHVAGPRPQRGSLRVTDATSSTQPPSTSQPQHPPSSSAAAIAASQAAAKQPSLRALKARDALERRASKRFSTYTFSKIAGPGHTLGNGTGSGLANLAHLGSTTPTSTPEAADEEEVLDDEPAPSRPPPRPPHRSGSLSSQRRSSGAESPQPRRDSKPTLVTLVDPPVSSQVEPTTTTTESTSPSSARKPHSVGPSSVVPTPDPSPRPSVSSTTTTARPPLSGEINVFVQQGRQTKRATLSLGIPLSIARLRMLFIDKFGYSPGKDDFPPIYVKDPKSGVDYELEESELVQVNTLGIDRASGVVKDGMLLSLNIEPLDQVKQHLDLTLGNLTREVRELKTAFQEREREARRASRNYGTLLDPNASVNAADATALSLSPLSSPKISDSQFAAAGQRMAQMRRANTLATRKSSNGPSTPQRSDSTFTAPDRTEQANGILGTLSPQPTGSSISSHVAGLATMELKTQYDEIARLRREFAILAQVQHDFQTDFKGLLGQLRAKTGRLREIAHQGVSMERNFIVAGKAKLDTTSQEVLTLVEDLQDTVDDLKLDVIQRGVKPKPALLKKISQDIEKAMTGVDELEKYVQTVKPNWKKTWEVELQNIVDEQEFLNHEEGLLSDLREDCAALQEVFGDIQQVVKLRVSSARAGSGGRGYLPPPPEEGHQGLDTVMLEVRGQAVDHDKRLRALEAAEEKRQRELASQTNEFADELAGFVDGKALRRTGGHVEADRVRQKRNDMTLRVMLTGEGVPGLPQASPNSAIEPPPKRLVWGGASGPTSPLKTSAPSRQGESEEAAGEDTS